VFLMSSDLFGGGVGSQLVNSLVEDILLVLEPKCKSEIPHPINIIGTGQTFPREYRDKREVRVT